jgi:hypothetical protein
MILYDDIILCSYVHIYICLCVGSNLQIDRTNGEPEEKPVHPFRNPNVVCVLYVNQEGVVVLSLNMS